LNALYNLARVTTATIGTGTITLGAAVSGFLTFAQAGVPDGAVVTYAINDGANSEIGQGSYTASGTTLTRNTIYRSTGAGNTARISLSGAAQVFICLAAEDVASSGTGLLVLQNSATLNAPTLSGTTLAGILSGAGNDYTKMQFTLSGGGTVTWAGAGGKLKWTVRFLAIPGATASTPNGYVEIDQPVTNIPAGQVWDGYARTADADGVVLTNWEALWAVHTVGGVAAAITYHITSYNAGFDAPSNWILVAAVNGDDGSIKLGNGFTLALGGTYTSTAQIGSYLPLAGGTVTGPITANFNAAPPAAYSGAAILGQYSGANGVGSALVIDGYGAGSVGLSMRRAGGTGASPSATPNGSNLFVLFGGGYGATGWFNGSGQMGCAATEAWSDTAQGSKWLLAATLTGTTTLSVVADFNPSAGVALRGAPTNSAAVAGFIGEYLTNNTNTVAMTSGVAITITSLSLSPGDWDVEGTLQFNPAGSTITQAATAGINLTNNTLPAAMTAGGVNQVIATSAAGFSHILPTGSQRVSIAVTTTVYLVGYVVFSTSTMTGSGFIRARRMR
jgi:hypothetical protein